MIHQPAKHATRRQWSWLGDETGQSSSLTEELLEHGAIQRANAWCPHFVGTACAQHFGSVSLVHQLSSVITFSLESRATDRRAPEAD